MGYYRQGSQGREASLIRWHLSQDLINRRAQALRPEGEISQAEMEIHQWVSAKE